MTKIKKVPAKKPKAGTSKQAADERRRIFTQAYIANNGNGKQAAIAAGFSEKTAEQQASRLLRDVKVKEMISVRAEAVANKYELTAELAARSIVQELTFDPAKLYNADGSLKQITELDEDTRMALTSVEFEQHGSPESPVFVRKVKWANRSSAREHLMRHRGMFEQDNKQRGLLADVSRDTLKAILERIKQIDG